MSVLEEAQRHMDKMAMEFLASIKVWLASRDDMDLEDQTEAMDCLDTVRRVIRDNQR